MMEWDAETVENAYIASNWCEHVWPWRLAVVSIPKLLNRLNADRISERVAVQLLKGTSEKLYELGEKLHKARRSRLERVFVDPKHELRFSFGPSGDAKRRFLEAVLSMSAVDKFDCFRVPITAGHFELAEVSPSFFVNTESVAGRLASFVDGPDDSRSALYGCLDALQKADWSIPVDEWAPECLAPGRNPFIPCTALFSEWPPRFGSPQSGKPKGIVPALYVGDGDGFQAAHRWLLSEFWQCADDTYSRLADRLQEVWQTRSPNGPGVNPLREFLDHPSAETRNRALRFLNCDCPDEIATDAVSPCSLRASGVSLLDVALLLSDGERDSAKMTRKRWQNSKKFKLPAKLGSCPEDGSSALYSLSALLDFVQVIEGLDERDISSLRKKLKHRERPRVSD